jgi:hypothetical protein
MGKHTYHIFFLKTSHTGLKKMFWSLLYTGALFCGCARAGAPDQTNFFCLFCMFYIKMKLLKGDRTQKKLSQSYRFYSANVCTISYGTIH